METETILGKLEPKLRRLQFVPEEAADVFENDCISVPFSSDATSSFKGFTVGGSLDVGCGCGDGAGRAVVVCNNERTPAKSAIWEKFMLSALICNMDEEWNMNRRDYKFDSRV